MAFGGGSQEMLELGEDLLDRVQVRAVGRQKEELCTDGTDGTAHPLSLVTAEVVEDDDVAGSQGWDEKGLDIGGEAFAIDRPVEDTWRINPVAAQGGEESECFPVPVRDLGRQSFAPRPPTSDRRHVGFDPGLVDEDEAAGVKLSLMALPACPATGDVWAILFARLHGFF